MKLGILCTHPIQYYTPLFRYLSGLSTVDLTVYYCQQPTPEQQGAGFGIPFTWDVSLTSGYKHLFLKNVSKSPDLLSFKGCDTPEIADIIKREKFDAFLLSGWFTKSMWQAMGACWSSGTPLLVRGDSHLHVPSSTIKKMAKKILYPWFIRKFSACLAVGKWSAEYFAHYGARQIIFSPHFVDNAWFAERAYQCRMHAGELRREWGIERESTVFLFAGKFEEKKRPMDILRTVKQLRNHGKQKLHLLMAGDGHLLAECKAFAQADSLPVTFAGFLNQTEIPKAYAISDALVLPSDGRETWGLVVNEAMACGLPAIVSDSIGCGPDLIREGETGYIYPCGDIAALAGKMENMMRQGSAAAMGRAAHTHIGEFSVAKAAKSILDAMEKVENDSQ